MTVKMSKLLLLELVITFWLLWASPKLSKFVSW